MIEVLPDFPANVLAFRGTGHITRQDYETVVVPAVEEAFKRHRSLRIYYEINHHFEGFGPGAMWEDFKVGMEHLAHWERIAVVTDVDWISNAMKVFGFMMPGDVRLFPLTDVDRARAWIVESAAPTS